jgi:hypothetical protein
MQESIEIEEGIFDNLNEFIAKNNINAVHVLNFLVTTLTGYLAKSDCPQNEIHRLFRGMSSSIKLMRKDGIFNMSPSKDSYNKSH